MKTKKVKRIASLFLICFALMNILSVPSLATSLKYSTSDITMSEGYIPIMPFWTNTLSASTNLTFSGRTSTGVGTISTFSGSTINATLTLYRINGGSRIFVTSWSRNVSSTSIVRFNETHTVSQAGTYILVLSATVTRNGVTDNISIESRQVTVS